MEMLMREKFSLPNVEVRGRKMLDVCKKVGHMTMTTFKPVFE
jgi:hypothetical protein